MNMEMQFPAIALLNKFLWGDVVLSEPIARELAIDKCSYVISNYPELFFGHPTVNGVRSFAELPPNTAVIDLTQAIINMEGEGENKRVLPDKFLAMCKQAGFQRRLERPELYLTANEWNSVKTIKSWFDGPRVGVILSSAHIAKNWFYMVPAIKRMAKNRWNIFIFAQHIPRSIRWQLPDGLHYITGGLKTREIMQHLAVMDVLLGPDTGPMHIGAALGVPSVVICFDVFTDLYEHYDGHIFHSDNFTLKDGIKGVAILPVIHKVAELIDANKNVHVSRRIIQSNNGYIQKHCYIRIRGIGDLLLSLPAIATEISVDPDRKRNKYVYITSPAGKKILDCSSLFDEVIANDYKHSTNGFPLPPHGIDYSEFSTVNNLINKIDFVANSDSVPRTELFAQQLGLEKCDYDTDWSITVPEKWKEDAWKILEQHGVNKDHRIVAFQVDCMGLSRGWPLVRCREFTGLAAKKGLKVVLLSDKTYRRFSRWSINLTGQLSIEEYIGMIAICTIGLSSDSALIHVAGVIGKNAVGLFGAIAPELRIAHYDTIYPIVGSEPCIPCNDWMKACCKDTHKKWPVCMWEIKAKKVLEEILEVLK